MLLTLAVNIVKILLKFLFDRRLFNDMCIGFIPFNTWSPKTISYPFTFRQQLCLHFETSEAKGDMSY